MFKKPSTGYKKKKKHKHKKIKSYYIGNLLVSNPKKISFNEKIVKFLIYLALRLVIRPKKWKDPKKNYEIIDRTYKRIMSADFIFIPSSIAFYLIMAFMPILSLIIFLYQFPAIQELLSNGHWTDMKVNITDGAGHQIESAKNFPLIGDLDSYKLLHPSYIYKVVDQGNWFIEDDLLGNVLGKFVPGINDIIKQMTELTKNDQKHMIKTGATIATVISLLVSTWIAAGGFSKLVFTQSHMYDHKFKGGYWMNKFKGMFMVMAFTIILFLALGINIIITKQVDDSSLSPAGVSWLKGIILIGGLFLGIFASFIALFKLSPRYSIKVKHIIPGAMVSTIPTVLFLALFGYISSLWSYGNYGTIGTIMYLGMGSLFITYFIFVGLSANVAYYKTFVGDKVKTKWTVSNK